MDDLDVQKACHAQLRKIVHEFSKVLTAQAEKLRDAQPIATDRMSLLLGAIIKLSQSAKAVLHLGGIGAVDEMNVLLRTQVELLVNVCYLQESSDRELNRFLHHDPISSRIAMEDFTRATGASVNFPESLANRVNKSARVASEASGLDYGARNWSKDTRTLKQRADAVDQKTGLCDLSGLMGSMYVTGSGYTHGSYKTLHRHARYLVTGQREHPVETEHGVNNALQGVSYIQLVLGRYLAFRLGMSIDVLTQLGAESTRILTIATHDLKRHRQAERALKPK